MSEVKFIKASSMIPAAEELLEAGKGVRITVTGMSMYPFLRENKDSVELVKVSYKEVSKGDILLVLKDREHYVLHRLFFKRKKHFYLNGDAQQWFEGPIYPDQLIAKVSKVYREDRCIDCSDKGWRALSFLWRLIFPLRYVAIKSYRKFQRMANHRIRSTLS
ncbi:S24/S26 family peptidase [Anaerocolumna sp. AGMB13025]|jgi:signal peptidase I|uniref:S24/S26 family peptidase n=1 Tax=Anaerocolumna sp. AGMB13025 TaxID=3039116 RepID=UPI00241EE926|nr:S24/S26 family peptidase [Anaerocolumna sp. AGMB13025]WFR57890.1 S24/S26 family peptidase [Anaerocolumna sp. AGMB13025]